MLRAPIVVALAGLVLAACAAEEPPAPEVIPAVPVEPAPAPAAPPTPNLPPPPTTPPVVPVAGAPTSFADLVSTVQPAVLNIYTTQVQEVRERIVHPFYGTPGYGPPQQRVAQSLGTGFLIDDRGHVLTNSHVIDGATTVRVRTIDDREFDAEVVGVDPLTDIAVIRVEPWEGMRVLPLGDSDAVRVGDWLIAVGNPFGLSSTVTAGILSARGRRDVPLGGDVRYIDFLQTDVSINPGNSGGPLVNMRGEAVGVNTAVNREGQGIGFAIPTNMARPIVEQLIGDGRVQRSWLGVYIEDVDATMAEALGLGTAAGAWITRVVPGGPAALAGLQAGDVIRRFGDDDVDDGDALMWIASTAGVGARVPVEVVRSGRAQTVTVTMGELPE